MGSNPTTADRFLYIRITYIACLEMRLKVELSKLIGRFCASWRKSKHFVFVATILASKQVYSFLIFKDTNHRQFLSFVALLVQTHRYFHLKMDRGVRMGPDQQIWTNSSVADTLSLPLDN